MTAQELAAIMPHAQSRGERFAPLLTAAMEEFDIDTRARRAAFLAQIAHESAELRNVEENLNYSASGLMRVWPARFPADIAQAYARQPEKIANRAYANRLGNGDEASGDGWRFRGSGLIQLTGKSNQLGAALYFDRDPESIGDWLRSDEGACRSAAWFWRGRDLNPLADGGQFVLITKKINGGIAGLADRQAYYQRAKEVLA